MIATPKDSNGRTRDARPDSPGDKSGARETQHPLQPLLEQIAVVREFALNYVEAQKDSVASGIRRALLKAITGLGGAIVAVTFVITCTVMLAQGLAELISMAAGGRAWVGNVALGGGVLLILALAVVIYVARQLRVARQKTIHKYEHRHSAQRAKFGTDVPQRAAT